MELCRSDDFRQLLHVDGLDVDDVCDASANGTCELSASEHILNDWSEILRFQRLIRRSSADMYVSWSELTEIEWMW